jgi:FKBP12-rapamycin complex-associated protein
MKRMTDKLMGRDHVVDGRSSGGGGNSGSSSSAADQTCDSVPAQVQRLIAQAISHENLCQSYIGWCPFW